MENTNSPNDTDKPPKRLWDLIVGSLLVIFGSYRIYLALLGNDIPMYRIIISGVFVIYGGYLVYKYQTS